MTDTPTTQLSVLSDKDCGTDQWADLVDHVASALKSEAVVHARPSAGPDSDQEILKYAASRAGPVLILPATARPESSPVSEDDTHPSQPISIEEAGVEQLGNGDTHHRNIRVLVPIDRSSSVRAASRPLIRLLRASGMEIEQLHILDQRARPAMWEGPGHHAAAWHSEMRRGQQVADEALTVGSGDTSNAIRAATARADLVVLCWKGDVSADRAQVLREVVRHSPLPLLLIPTRSADMKHPVPSRPRIRSGFRPPGRPSP